MMVLLMGSEKDEAALHASVEGTAERFDKNRSELVSTAWRWSTKLCHHQKLMV